MVRAAQLFDEIVTYRRYPTDVIANDEAYRKEIIPRLTAPPEDSPAPAK
jgi:hypothetical protein